MTYAGCCGPGDGDSCLPGCTASRPAVSGCRAAASDAAVRQASGAAPRWSGSAGAGRRRACRATRSGGQVARRWAGRPRPTSARRGSRAGSAAERGTDTADDPLRSHAVLAAARASRLARSLSSAEGPGDPRRRRRRRRPGWPAACRRRAPGRWRHRVRGGRCRSRSRAGAGAVQRASGRPWRRAASAAWPSAP